MILKETARPHARTPFLPVFKRLLHELVESSRYDTRSDFTVVIQPFFRDIVVPRLPVSNTLCCGGCHLVTKAWINNFFFFSYKNSSNNNNSSLLWLINRPCPCLFHRMVAQIAPFLVLTASISARKPKRWWLAPSGTTWYVSGRQKNYVFNLYNTNLLSHRGICIIKNQWRY